MAASTNAGIGVMLNWSNTNETCSTGIVTSDKTIPTMMAQYLPIHVSATHPITGSSKQPALSTKSKANPISCVNIILTATIKQVVAEYSNPLMTNSSRVPREKVKYTQHLLVVHETLLVVAIDKVEISG